jgi:hypothetical protein
MRATVVAFLAFSLFFLGCSKRTALSPRIVPKNPPSVPTTTETGEIDPQVVRTEIPRLVLNYYFEKALQDKGVYTPDVCFQLVKLTKGTQTIGTYVEMSSVPCPGSGLVAESDVLLRLKAEQSQQYGTQYRVIYEQSYSPEIGAFRRIVTNGVTEYQMEGLCDIDVQGYNESWDTYCQIAVEGSLFRNPDPLDFYNLD